MPFVLLSILADLAEWLFLFLWYTILIAMYLSVSCSCVHVIQINHSSYTEQQRRCQGMSRNLRERTF